MGRVKVEKMYVCGSGWKASISHFSVQPHPKGSSRLVFKQKQFVLAATDYEYNALTSQPILFTWGNQINRAK